MVLASCAHRLWWERPEPSAGSPGESNSRPQLTESSSSFEFQMTRIE